MPGHRPHAVLAIVSKLYQALLVVYPAEHRREYGPLLIQTFRDMCQETYRQKGVPGLILIAIHTLVDTLVSSIVEHLDRMEYGAIKMTRKQHFFILVRAGFPIFLGLGLLALNPRYMGRMFVPGYTNVQPQGMIMTAAIIVMAVAAYVTQRWSLTLSGKLAGKGRTAIPTIFYVGSFILFVLPAVLLVIFGPAVLVLMETGIIG